MGAAINPERIAFGQSMMLLATSLQQELDEAQLGVYWHHLKTLPAWLRSETMAKASGMTWFRFPQPGQLKVVADGILETRRTRAAQVHLAHCTHSSRWIETDRGLARCPCHILAVQAMAQVGERLALAQGDQPYQEEE